MDNHYHTIGYLKIGDNLAPMMQKLHGSVAKLANDLLPRRVKPFWQDANHHNYYDGCIRDVLQARRAYRYTQLQSVRHKIVTEYHAYPHTIVNVELERAIPRAVELNAFLDNVPYARYEKYKRR